MFFLYFNIYIIIFPALILVFVEGLVILNVIVIFHNFIDISIKL